MSMAPGTEGAAELSARYWQREVVIDMYYCASRGAGRVTIPVCRIAWQIGPQQSPGYRSVPKETGEHALLLSGPLLTLAFTPQNTSLTPASSS